jgi:hypothetical protein
LRIAKGGVFFKDKNQKKWKWEGTWYPPLEGIEVKEAVVF